MNETDNLIVNFMEPGTPTKKEVLAVIIYPGGAKDGGESVIPDRIMEYFLGIRKGTVAEFRSNHPYQGEDEIRAADEYISRVYSDADEIDFSKISSERLRLLRICEYLGGGLANIGKSPDRRVICEKFPDEFFKTDIICDEKRGIAGYTFGLTQYAVKKMNREGRRNVDVFLEEDLLGYTVRTGNI